MKVYMTVSKAEKALIEKLREAVKYCDDARNGLCHKTNETCMVEMAGKNIMANAYKWSEE